MSFLPSDRMEWGEQETAGWCDKEWEACLRRVARESLSEEVTFEQNQKEPTRIEHGEELNTLQRKGNSTCKGPGAGMHWCSRAMGRQMYDEKEYNARVAG